MGTTKKRFIELHGEEAWKEERKRRNGYSNKYKIKNSEKVKAGHSLYYSEHKIEYSEYQKEYIKTKEGRAKILAGNYKRIDKETGFNTSTITQKWILENIFTSSCTYCGETDWRKLGCDRIDNSLPHTPENCVCACLYCNSQRGDRWSVEEFKTYKQQRAAPN